VGLAFDSGGNLYAANFFDAKITKFTPAGVGSLFFSGVQFPYGLAIDSVDNIYLAYGTFQILKITPGGVGTVYADNASAGVHAPTYLAFAPIVIQPPFGFRVTDVARVGSDLQLTFTTMSGFNYVIQSCADLSIGAWLTIPGTTIAGTGGTVQETVVNAFAGPPQFYRAFQL
jgi:hypothetical protein